MGVGRRPPRPEPSSARVVEAPGMPNKPMVPIAPASPAANPLHPLRQQTGQPLGGRPERRAMDLEAHALDGRGRLRRTKLRVVRRELQPTTTRV